MFELDEYSGPSSLHDGLLNKYAVSITTTLQQKFIMFLMMNRIYLRTIEFVSFVYGIWKWSHFERKYNRLRYFVVENSLPLSLSVSLSET